MATGAGRAPWAMATYLVDARLGDLDLALGLAAAGSLSLDGLDDVHAVDDLAEDDVLAVELRLVQVCMRVCVPRGSPRW